MRAFILIIIKLCALTSTIWICQAEDLPLPVHITTACYGHGDLDRDFLSPGCGVGESIAMRYVRHGSKLKTSTCPSVLTANDTSIGQCCSVEPADCHFRLPHNQTLSFFEECSGRSTCSVRVGRERILQTGSCDVSQHMELSNYMMAEYYCVPESSILLIEDPGSHIYPSIFLSHQTYPSSMAVHPGYLCYISVCSGQLDLIALDLKIGCDKHLFIEDDFVVHNITCDDNNQYNIRSILVSKSNHLTLKVPSDFDGQFWFYISASSSQNVTVECGSTDLHYTSEICLSSAASSASGDTSGFYLSSLWPSTIDLSVFESDVVYSSADLYEPSQTYLDQLSSQIKLSSSDIIMTSSLVLSYSNSQVTTNINHTHMSVEPSQIFRDSSANVHNQFSGYETVLYPSYTGQTSVEWSSIRSPNSGNIMTSTTATVRSPTDISSSFVSDHAYESGFTNVLKPSVSSFIDENRVSVASETLQLSHVVDSTTSVSVSTTQATTFAPKSIPSSNTGAVAGGVVSTLLVLIGLLLAAFVIKKKCFKNKIAQTSPEDGNKVDDQQEYESEMFFNTPPPVANKQVPPAQTTHLPAPSSSNRLPPLYRNHHGVSPDVSTGKLDDSIFESSQSKSLNPEPSQKFDVRLLTSDANQLGKFPARFDNGSLTTVDEYLFEASHSNLASQETLPNSDTPFPGIRILPSLPPEKNVQCKSGIGLNEPGYTNGSEKKKKKKKHKREQNEEEAAQNLNVEEGSEKHKRKKKKKKKKKKSDEEPFDDYQTVKNADLP